MSLVPNTFIYKAQNIFSHQTNALAILRGLVTATNATYLGNIKTISGEIPHPPGKISVSYDLNKKLMAVIILPKGVTEDFLWTNKSYK